MNRNAIYFVDENAEQRRAFALTLSELFQDSGLIISARAPLPAPADYNALLTTPDLAAFIVDQKMEDGGVSYSGTQLASYLRGVAPKLPIFILTNYTEDKTLFEEGEGDVEDILSKKVIADPTTREAQIFKARLLRRLDTFADVLGEREKRFHDLVIKSMKGPLTSEEEKEIGMLEDERLVPVQVEELRDSKALEKAIEELKAKLDPEQLHF